MAAPAALPRALSFLHFSQQRLPVPSVDHAGQTGIPQKSGRLPAMIAVSAAEDNGFAQGADPFDIGLDAVGGNIQGPWNMTLVVFIGSPQIDDHRTFPQCIPDSSASAKKFR